jgi:hypothetical protein
MGGGAIPKESFQVKIFSLTTCCIATAGGAPFLGEFDIVYT